MENTEKKRIIREVAEAMVDLNYPSSRQLHIKYSKETYRNYPSAEFYRNNWPHLVDTFIPLAEVAVEYMTSYFGETSTEQIEALLREKGIPEKHMKDAIEIVVMRMEKKRHTTIEQAIEFVVKWVDLNEDEDIK